jgi:AcrR family transcriptional regulator
VHPRVRRDTPEAQAELRRCAVEAALALFAAGGVDAVSMRAVAAACSVTPMALYRYFESKTELLLALWEHVLQALMAALDAADRVPGSASARLRASVQVFLAHWEAHPEHFKLVYMSSCTSLMTRDPRFTGVTVYRGLLDSSLRLTQEFAGEQGLPTERALLARDLRHALMVGYLHSRLVNLRYPWSDLEALRDAVVDSVLLSVTNCLRGPLT